MLRNQLWFLCRAMSYRYPKLEYLAARHVCHSSLPQLQRDNLHFQTHLFLSHNMNSLLLIASRIEAAVASYVSVQNGTDKAEWKHRFDMEKVSAPSNFPYFQSLTTPI